ncbi:ROK family protein, partial [Escherichia coli]|uniref:ROK family protein n=2 Tax=Bacteria TaxID=2 RepID=UPI003CFB0203
TPYSDIDSIPLKDLLAKEIPYPIVLINEANAGALGEYTFQTPSENLININIQDGIGAGIVENGKLFTGANGTAGEIGHTTLYPDGILCPCGNHGCL